MGNVGLSSPWVIYYREIEALFGQDPEIKIEFDNDTVELKLFIDNNEKVEALEQLLPNTVAFGNVELKIYIIPANVKTARDYKALYTAAFRGNPAFKKCVNGGNPITSSSVYVVFKKEVVQFFDDDLTDINGNRSTLYQDIAKEIFREEAGVNFCTDTE